MDESLAGEGSGFVKLTVRRNRGWPSPESSWGLEPMFGEGGWCRSCGIPAGPQRGPLTLQRRGLTCTGAWVPNWRFDAICLAGDVAEAVRAQFQVDLIQVAWARKSGEEAWQIVPTETGEAWFQADEIRAAAIARHGADGTRCTGCGVWKWLPVPLAELSRPRLSPACAGHDVVASLEWFGDGMKAFRQILVRRPLADLVVARSPRDFVIEE